MVSTRSSSVRGDSVDPDSQSPPARAVTRPATRSRRAAAAAAAFQHVPTPLTLAWMAVSLPLVIWDTGYVLGRPHTMEGGFLYWPLYVPYKLYGTVDYVYGWKAFNARDGFTAAQGSLNLLETVMYFVYLWLVLAPASASAGEPTSTTRRVEGKTAAYAVLVGFSAAVMTLSKTLLYCKLSLHPAAREWPRLARC